MEPYQNPYAQAELLLHYLRKEATPAEEQQVETWLNQDQNNRQFLAQLQSEQGLFEEKNIFDHLDKNETWVAIRRAIQPQTRRLWPRIAVAASILFVISMGAYFYLHQTQPVQLTAIRPHNFKSDVQPGGNKAILTLSNGNQLILTDAKNGTLASQGHTSITKAADGRIVYNASDGKSKSDNISYNTISTPASGRWEVILPDKSHVWLDALSSIRFPTAFIGKNRKVEIKGQAYFEVAHNAIKPFLVSSKGQTVQVLGTHFNINAYDDEPVIKTTLLEGSVKINQTTTLKPGEQAINSSKGIRIEQIDADNAIGWKRDDFVFNGENFDEAMRMLARWYDVEIVYANNVNTKNILPGGWVSRKNNISVILKRIEAVGEVHFRIEGRRVIIK